MKYFLDTEFNGVGGDLISLALVAEDGREFYVAKPDLDLFACGSWVAANVLPIIDVPGAKANKLWAPQIAFALAKFLQRDPAPVIVADWPDDIAYFCRAIITGPGQMADISGLAFELVRVDAYPTDLPDAVQHNALWDARALRHALSPPRSPAESSEAK